MNNKVATPSALGNGTEVKTGRQTVSTTIQAAEYTKRALFGVSCSKLGRRRQWEKQKPRRGGLTDYRLCRQGLPLLQHCRTGRKDFNLPQWLAGCRWQHSFSRENSGFAEHGHDFLRRLQPRLSLPRDPRLPRGFAFMPEPCELWHIDSNTTLARHEKSLQSHNITKGIVSTRG